MYLHTLTLSHEHTGGCHFCIERLTAGMSDSSLGKRTATDQAATEKSLKRKSLSLGKIFSLSEIRTVSVDSLAAVQRFGAICNLKTLLLLKMNRIVKYN